LSLKAFWQILWFAKSFAILEEANRITSITIAIKIHQDTYSLIARDTGGRTCFLLHISCKSPFVIKAHTTLI